MLRASIGEMGDYEDRRRAACCIIEGGKLIATQLIPCTSLLELIELMQPQLSALVAPTSALRQVNLAASSTGLPNHSIR